LALAWAQFAREAQVEGLAIVVDHGGRHESAAEAAEAVERLADFGIQAKVRTLRQDVRSENEMRNARYDELAQVAAEFGADFLLTAHHADDLAETVLLRLMRGTGLRGLTGIPSRRKFQLPNGREIEIRRPLLNLRASEIREFLSAAAIPWTEDPTNQDPEYAARNRLRKEILPALETIATGDPIKAVLRIANEASDWQNAMSEFLENSTDWNALPSYLRQQAIAEKLRELGETVSPARLRDLESSLLKNGLAGVNQRTKLKIDSGAITYRKK
tara:strand:+ start:22228 stop:23046 length:819 start_codon:yes stop_codon:yes gene_type:complete